MHGRRSIIKRRDDDDITMTRPLNKRVSFSANNYTRLFQVDSDESTRNTNLDSTGHQSAMSSMEHTMTHTLSMSQFNRSSSTTAMETTHLEDVADGFDWMDENMEVDSEPPLGQEEPDGTSDCCQTQPNQTTVNQPSIDGDDKTRPVELRREQTDCVKDEMLKVASNLLKPARSSDETRSALDIYGIQATLSSQTGRQEKAESLHELDNTGTPVMRENLLCSVLDASNRAPSESWFEVTGVTNFDQDEEPSLPRSERAPSPGSALDRSACLKESTTHCEVVGEDADSDESQLSNRLAMSRDSLVRPGFGNTLEESSAAESTDDAPEEPSTAITETTNPMSHGSMETGNETVEAIDQSDNEAPKLLFPPKQLSPCLEVSSIRSERRTFDVSPSDTTLIPSCRRTFDKVPVDSDVLIPKRRTFDKSPAELGTLQPKRTTFDIPAANETFSVLHGTQEKENSDGEISVLADEVEPSLYQNATLALSQCSDRSTCRAPERPAANRSLEEWIQLDPDLISVFAEPLAEHDPVPCVEMTDKQIIELDEERLEKALTLEEDEELDAYLRSERTLLQDLLDAQRLLLSKLKAQLIRETTVLFDELPFYRALSPTKFKISSDSESKVVSAWYRYCSIPCVLIECREEKDGIVKGTAKAIDVPTSVCPLISYVSSWIKNALGGGSNFNSKSWSEAQSKVISVFEVIDASFNAFESVKFRLLWCEERRQVFLKMLWRSRVINAYVDADLKEELLPQDSSTTLSFRRDDLHAAWRGDGVSTYRDRINKVHRRNLEIVAEEMIQAATF